MTVVAQELIGGLVGIAVGAVIVIAFSEWRWRRETGEKWFWKSRD